MSEGYDVYCGLLRMYDGFSETPDAGVPAFEYDHSHYGLAQLRQRYRLDGVAGDGDALTRSLRLGDWLHRHVRHFDTREQLEQNSLSLLEYAFDNGREAGINCVMQSVVLVEACLSVGLQARTIALHPLSPYDLDQHYVTVVWTGPSSQWVMLDPSFGSCFRDPDGTILSPWQLRRRFAGEAEVSCEAPTDFGEDPKRAAAERSGAGRGSITALREPRNPRLQPSPAARREQGRARCVGVSRRVAAGRTPRPRRCLAARSRPSATTPAPAYRRCPFPGRA